MKILEIEQGIADYIHTEIASKATGLQKFLIYTGSILGVGKLEQVVLEKQDLLKSLDIINSDGEIDIDKLYTASKESMNRVGQFEYKGIIFNSQDIDKLYNYIIKRRAT